MPGNADGIEDDTDNEGNDIQAFADMEVETIKDNIAYELDENNTFNMLVQLDFVTGLRLGELLGLKKNF